MRFSWPWSRPRPPPPRRRHGCPVRGRPPNRPPRRAAACRSSRSIPAWPAVPAGMRLGAPSSIAIDAEDNVWVLHRPLTLPAEEDAMAAPPVVVFDAEGNFIRAWGGPGDGYEWPQREHGLHIDHEGFVWLGGNNCPTNGVPRVEPVSDDQLLKFTRDGAFVMQIGRTDGSRGNADMMNVHRPADQQVHPPTNELFVADGYGNRRVAVFDAGTGRFKRRWGAFGDTPVDDDQCQVQNPTSFSDPGPSYFNVLHAIRVSNDGLVYAADREHRRVQVFTLGGAFMSQVITPDAPFARNLALSPRPRAAVPLRRRRRRHRRRRPRDARDTRNRPPRGHPGRRPPHRDRFAGQSLPRGDGRGHAEADIQGDVRRAVTSELDLDEDDRRRFLGGRRGCQAVAMSPDDPRAFSRRCSRSERVMALEGLGISDLQVKTDEDTWHDGNGAPAPG